DTVVITGTGFGPPNDTPVVMFGPNAAAPVTVNSDTQMTVTSPPGSGVVDVVVTTSFGGTSATSSADQFHYGPIVTGLSPNAGPVAGGTSVTVTGSGFTSGGTPTVFFGGVAASSTVVDDSTITAVSPAHAAGTVDVTVGNSVGTSAG